jgi:hypothetical protein
LVAVSAKRDRIGRIPKGFFSQADDKPAVLTRAFPVCRYHEVFTLIVDASGVFQLVSARRT